MNSSTTNAFLLLVWDIEAEMVFYCSSAEVVGGSCEHQIEVICNKIGSVWIFFLNPNLSLTIAIIKFKVSYQFDSPRNG